MQLQNHYFTWICEWEFTIFDDVIFIVEEKKIHTFFAILKITF